ILWIAEERDVVPPGYSYECSCLLYHQGTSYLSGKKFPGERIPHEASPASIPQRHVAEDSFPQRHVAGEIPDMSPGKRAIVVVLVCLRIVCSIHCTPGIIAAQDGEYIITLSNTRNRQEVSGSFVAPTHPTNSSQHDIRMIRMDAHNTRQQLALQSGRYAYKLRYWLK
ncbi:hypothetical protein Tco_1053012, partial [Tanacetum coccineum]